jgi:fatty-acyl-CoA synthase
VGDLGRQHEDVLVHQRRAERRRVDRPSHRLNVSHHPPRNGEHRTATRIGYNSRVADLQYATVWETVADTVPGNIAAIQGDRRVTWAELDDAAARLATALSQRGVGKDSKVALHLFNSVEYLIAQYAAFKLRAAAVNVNFRYLDAELAYVLDNSDSEVVVSHTSLSPTLVRALPNAPRVHAVVAVDDGGSPVEGAERFDDLVADSAPMPRIERSGDDLYMLYTGGTTGMPKGVMYRHADHASYVQGLGYRWLGLEPPTTVEDVPVAIQRAASLGPLLSVAPPPLMHGTATWLGVFAWWGMGGGATLLSSRSFDPVELWETVQRERASGIVIVGDAFGRPMLRVLDEAVAARRPYDLSSLRVIVSSGAMWSADVQQGLLDYADIILVDSMGSTEGGMASRRITRQVTPETGRFELRPGVRVLDEHERDVPPGSGQAGVIFAPARAHGYYKDPAKTAATFREIDGIRYVSPGDWAIPEPDGTIHLLGRGSQTINTGGEKVHPEEVEEVVKTHPGVEDCVVLGLPHERFGQQVVAVVSPAASSSSGTSAPIDTDDVRAWVQQRLAGYKVPRQFVVVPVIQRMANGKADYAWAKQAASEPT